MLECKIIGAHQQSSKGLRFQSSDGKTTVCLERTNGGSLQIEVNGEWLWLSPNEALIVKKWLNGRES